MWARAALIAGIALASACKDGPSEPATGSLVVNISGLPATSQGAVRISGPTGGSNVTRTLSASDTLDGLVPGVYVVAGNEVVAPTGTYASTTTSQQIEVLASSTPASVSVVYEITTGSIALNVTGLPVGAAAAVTISGTGGYYRQVTNTETLTSLQPGEYLISSNSVSEESGHVYAPSPIAQNITVLASETPRNVTARYALATGSLNVVVSGLPPQRNADVIVSGPGGFRRSLTTSETIAGLFPGTYSILSQEVAGTPTYRSTLPTQSADVSPSLTPFRVEVTYSEVNQPPPPAFNLTIAGMYVTQAIQSFTGAVPLIGTLPGLVRVFVKGSAPNTVSTTARLRVYLGDSLAQTISLLPNVPGVPVAITEGTLSSSWNAILPASVIQPGLRLVADVDPSNAVAESSEDDNRYPAVGTFDPRVDVPPPLNLTIVPVLQTATGLTGSVSAANVDEYLSFIRKVMPIRDYRVNVHEVFTSASPALESNDGNGGWFHVLGEINALRVAEGSTDYYLGIVGTTYNSGVVGLAFVPGRTAIGWDRLPSAARVAAHELGHSFGRRHAPCGGVAFPDPSFPHALGTIGVYGYDVSNGILTPPGTSDLMGYCGFGWISDYNYLGILDYRASTPNAAISPRPAPARLQRAEDGPALVVWGRIADGKPVLEPAFTTSTRPSLPTQTGPYRIEARTADGRTLFSYSFEGEEPAHITGRIVRQFAFAIPISDDDARQVHRLTLSTAAGARTELVAPAVGADALEATVESPTTIRFRITDSSTRLAVVRDRTTNRILAFVRGGGSSVVVRSAATDFNVQFTDGVRTRSRTVRPVKR